MSLFGTLNTSVSGMAAQASKLGTIGDNIANASTTGYKDASTEFETVLGNQSAGTYNSGGVSTKVRYGITTQGTVQGGQSSVSDLAVNGNGFFVVQDSAGGTALTRAGAFVPNAAGNLVNTAGYKLMGYSLTGGSTATVNGTGGLVPVTLSTGGLTATPTTSGTLSVNLPSTATAVTTAANLPSANPNPTATPPVTADYTEKTSLAVYDNQGNQVTLDVYMTKTSNNTWEAAVYNHADANSATGGFPYASGPLNQTAAVAPSTTPTPGQMLSFDGNGQLVSGGDVTLTIPNGQPFDLNMGASTQLAAPYTPSAATVNGNAPSQFDHFTIDKDGTVSSVFTSGATLATYRIPLASVQSPDNLTSLPGNVYETNTSSGSMLVGIAQTGKLGEIDANSLESSTVDIATELTSMIAAQRSYQANSQVLQTSSDLLSVLNNIHA